MAQRFAQLGSKAFLPEHAAWPEARGVLAAAALGHEPAVQVACSRVAAQWVRSAKESLALAK